jgi:hypothetical protein
MRNSNNFLGITLALLIGVGAISGCAPTGTTTPNQPATTDNKPSTSTPVATTPSTSNSATTTPSASAPVANTPASSTATTPVAKKQASSDLKEALTSDLDDEAYMNDSESISSDGFATKALGIGDGSEVKPGEMRATLFGGTPAVSADAKAEAKADAKEKKAEAKENLKEARAELKEARKAVIMKRGKVFVANLEATGAVTKNEDGTFKVDAVKLKAEFDKKKNKLQAKVKVAQEKISKLRRKNNTDVQKSEPETVTNADGSITKTTKVHFENTRLGITRDNVVSITTKDGKVVSSTHSLDIKAKNYTKVSTRLMTVNEDGSRDVVFDSTTTWTDGRKKEVHRTKEIGADGKGVGTGTIKITNKAGEMKEYKTNSDITVTNMGKPEEKAQETTTAIDPTTNVEVKVVEQEDGTATAEVKEEGKVTETAPVNVEQAVEASATTTA